MLQRRTTVTNDDYHDTTTTNYNNNHDDENHDDPLTEENVEYELSRAFVRLYQKDCTLRCIDLYDITEENAISILSVIMMQQQQATTTSNTTTQNNTTTNNNIAHGDDYKNDPPPPPSANHLQELCLTYSNLSWNIIPVLSIGTNLRILDLGGNQLGDEGVEALMNVLSNNNSGHHHPNRGCCSLKFLNLSDNQIGIDGVCAIADANVTIGLQSLCLCQNPNIGQDHTTSTLAGDALLQLAATLQVIFCWDNGYSYTVKEMLQNSSHPKLFWVRPYHWESELQRARDKALRHVEHSAEDVQIQYHENRMVDPEHYVSTLLPQTNDTYRAARQHLVDNFHPAMLDPTLLHQRTMMINRRPKVPGVTDYESSPTTVVTTTTTTSSSGATRKIMTLEEKLQAQETKAEVKARLRRRREEIANGKDMTTATTTTTGGIVRTTTIIDGIPVTFLSSAPPVLSSTTATSTTTKKEYGTSARRWKPCPTDAAATTDDNDNNSNSNHLHHSSQDNDNEGSLSQLMQQQERSANYDATRRANRRQNARRQKMIQNKLATVVCETQYATAKAKLEILERHQELAHQYI